ncbi:MAG: type II toxin-antitoxin system RelE/ParE family toxin [Chloroflexi bacterium]|nr:type II toxin-antitoxin system RelE/ParE family toxin [Chloroflexota bacterium]
MYDLYLTDEARRFYDRAEVPLIRKLNRCFEQIQADPYKHPNIKPLRGRLAGFLRYRIGDWRVIYPVDDQAKRITVLLIAHRSRAYE